MAGPTTREPSPRKPRAAATEASWKCPGRTSWYLVEPFQPFPQEADKTEPCSSLSGGGGRNGTLLLDPTNLTISNAAASANNVNIGSLTTALGTNNVVISTNPAGAQDGSVLVSENVTYTSGNDFAVLAHGDVEFRGLFQNGGNGRCECRRRLGRSDRFRGHHARIG